MTETVKKESGGQQEDRQELTDKRTGTSHGVPAGAAKEESPGSYGGTDRLQSEVGPIQDSATKDQGRDI